MKKVIIPFGVEVFTPEGRSIKIDPLTSVYVIRKQAIPQWYRNIVKYNVSNGYESDSCLLVEIYAIELRRGEKFYTPEGLLAGQRPYVPIMQDYYDGKNFFFYPKQHEILKG